MNFITITGNSASGKTTLGKELEARGWNTVYNYTTRQPRGDEELDSYIFLTEEQFEFKKSRGDFIEHIEYNGNKYAMSSIMPEGNVYVIVTPDGRRQIMDLWRDGGIHKDNFRTFFIYIDEDLQKQRLIYRGDSEEEINKRIKDNFDPTTSCIILNGSADSEELADIIEETLGV